MGKRNRAKHVAPIVLAVTFVSCVRTSVTYRIESTNDGKVAVAQVTRQRGYFVEDPREWVALAWEVLSSHEGAAVLRFLGLEGSV